MNLAKDNLSKKLFEISWPIFVEFILFMLLGSVDIFMLGKYSDDAVAGIGVVNQIINMVNILFGIITSGTSIVCAQYIGAKRSKEDVIKLVGTSLIVNLILGSVLSIVLVVFASKILHIMNLAPELIGFSSQFLKIVGGFIFVQAISLTFTAVLRSYGKTKICMFVTLFMNIINIIGNYIFIFGNFGAPKLGVLGSAVSTSGSKIIGAIILGIILFTNILKGFSLSFLKKFPKQELINIFKMGGPAAGEELSYNLTKLTCTIILTFIGTAALTTNSYINIICMFIYVFSTSIGQGTAILVGRLVGEEKQEEAYQLCFKSLKKAFTVSTIIGILVAVFARQILGVFTTNEDVLTLGASVLLVNAFLEPGRTFNVIIINSLRAAGDVKFPVYIGICSMWTIGVGLSYILSIKLGLGMPGMWAALALDEWTRGIIMNKRWRSRKWCGKGIASINEKDKLTSVA